jgi:hypothetical protein
MKLNARMSSVTSLTPKTRGFESNAPFSECLRAIAAPPPPLPLSLPPLPPLTRVEGESKPISLVHKCCCCCLERGEKERRRNVFWAAAVFSSRRERENPNVSQLRAEFELAAAAAAVFSSRREREKQMEKYLFSECEHLIFFAR